MTFLVLFHRQMQIKNQIADKNYQLMQKQKELMDLQSYTSSIADGRITYNELSTAAPSMFGRMSQYAAYSNAAAMMGAQQQMALMGQAGMLNNTQTTDPIAQQAYQQVMYQNLYNQQIEQFQKTEEAALQIKNKQIDNECIQIKNELNMLEKEYDTLKGVVDNAAKSAVPEYSA